MKLPPRKNLSALEPTMVACNAIRSAVRLFEVLTTALSTAHRLRGPGLTQLRRLIDTQDDPAWMFYALETPFASTIARLTQYAQRGGDDTVLESAETVFDVFFHSAISPEPWRSMEHFTALDRSSDLCACSRKQRISRRHCTDLGPHQRRGPVTSERPTD